MGFELFWNQVITLDTVTQQQTLEQFAHEAKLLQISSTTTREGISRSYSYQPIPRAAWPDDLFVSLEAGKAYLLLLRSGARMARGCAPCRLFVGLWPTVDERFRGESFCH